MLFYGINIARQKWDQYCQTEEAGHYCLQTSKSFWMIYIELTCNRKAHIGIKIVLSVLSQQISLALLHFSYTWSCVVLAQQSMSLHCP